MADPMPQMTHVGLDRRPFADAYHFLMTISWLMFLATVALAFTVYNALFAVLYLVGGDCIGAQDPSSFLEAFSFSVQTMSSTGYGAMSPQTAYAHIVSIVESFGGLLGTAMVTGLMFAKFARPTARIGYSDKMVVVDYDGQPTLQFRLANQRHSKVVGARIQVNALIDVLTAEGQSIRRLMPLRLLRDQSPAFRMSWIVIHPLDADSPVRELAHGHAPPELLGVMVNTVGMDEVFSQTVHAQVVYGPQDIVFGHLFADMVSGNFASGMIVDHGRLHDIEPAGYDPAEEDG